MKSEIRGSYYFFTHACKAGMIECLRQFIGRDENDGFFAVVFISFLRYVSENLLVIDGSPYLAWYGMSKKGTVSVKLDGLFFLKKIIEE